MSLSVLTRVFRKQVLNIYSYETLQKENFSHHTHVLYSRLYDFTVNINDTGLVDREEPKSKL